MFTAIAKAQESRCADPAKLFVRIFMACLGLDTPDKQLELRTNPGHPGVFKCHLAVTQARVGVGASLTQSCMHVGVIGQQSAWAAQLTLTR